MNKNKNWFLQEAVPLREKGMSYGAIANALGMANTTVKSAFQRAGYKGAQYISDYIQIADKPTENNIGSTFLTLLKSGATIEQISRKTELPELAVDGYIKSLITQGYQIEQDGNTYQINYTLIEQEPTIHKKPWNGEKIIRFGLMGDTQINSNYTQITHLHNLYDLYEREGITEVYHVGDIDEGEEMRKGHKYECYKQGADAHVEEIVKVYPKRNGITTHFITGNHDASMIKNCGYDIGYTIADKRSDMNYLGRDCAIIMLTPNCSLELRHPWDGTAYALSYKIQKMVESMGGGEKPNILAVGHYHKSEYFFYRNVHCIQTGCLQAQTGFMRGKGISAMMGGWIIEAHVSENGTITRLKAEFIPYYTAIKDDYKNWA